MKKHLTGLFVLLSLLLTVTTHTYSQTADANNNLDLIQPISDYLLTNVTRN